MKSLLACAVLLVLSGCGEADRMASACQSIIRDSLVDPESMAINEQYTVSADMKLSETYTAISKKYHGNTPAAVTAQTDQLVNREELPKLLTLAVDYTATGGAGKIRDVGACTFIVGAMDKPFLHAVRLRAEEFKADQLDKLFLAVKRPSQLDSLYFVN